LILGLIIAAAAFAVDQLSKNFIANLFAADAAVKSFGSYFNVVEAWNTGVSFSMLNNGGVWGTVLLSMFAIGVVVFLLAWLKNEQSTTVQAALGLIIGGALGNVVDRIRFGAVYDFLDFHYGTWHWPAFNAADSFICIGAFLIILHSLLTRKTHSLKEIAK
jgi:signal peptidase II